MEKIIKDEEIIDAILPETSQAFLIDYLLNGLTNKKFCEGLKISDFDIILSTNNAEDKKIFHSLNICNTKFDPSTAPSRKIIIYKDLYEVIEPFINGKKLAEQNFKEVTIHVYPKIRRNLRFDITSLTYKVVKDNNVVDYKMEHENTNSDNKDILCICSFKLNGKKHKFEKILQLLEQFKQLGKEFFEYHRIAYIIFCIKEENSILSEYENFPDELKKVNENFDKVRMIFYVSPQGESEDEIANMFALNDLGKNFYFHMNSNHVIYKADNMLHSGDLIEDSINYKNKEKEINKYPQQIINERNEAFYNFYNFLKNIKDYKYSLYMSFDFEICLRYDEDLNLSINYIDFSHINAELRTKEYNLIKKAADILKPETTEIDEIPTTDIPIDFSDMECFRCGKKIGNIEDFYYCYKCNYKYCKICVIDNYNKNNGKDKFIDQKHNLLYFKTRDLNSFKDIDIHKLGNDSFSQCTDNSKLSDHSALCIWCNERFKNSPRYLCLQCKSGKKQLDGYNDYCLKCIQHMMSGDKEGEEIQKKEERIYSEETRILYGEKITYRHDNDKHIYLMIAMEYIYNDNNPYFTY